MTLLVEPILNLLKVLYLTKTTKLACKQTFCFCANQMDQKTNKFEKIPKIFYVNFFKCQIHVCLSGYCEKFKQTSRYIIPVFY